MTILAILARKGRVRINVDGRTAEDGGRRINVEGRTAEEWEGGGGDGGGSFCIAELKILFSRITKISK